MTPLQREELDEDIRHLDHGHEWEPLNVRQPSKDWPNWIVLTIWCVIYLVGAVLAWGAFCEAEKWCRVLWPSL